MKFPDDAQPVLIFGQCPVHKKKNVIEAITERGGKYFLIPVGCTGYLHPLDVVINKPFKDRVKSFFKDWIDEESLNPINVTNQANIKPPSTDAMIEWSLKALADINKGMISNYFKTRLILI